MSSSTLDVELAQLKEEFAAFRAAHRSGGRLPEALKIATLEVLSRGVPEEQVRRACRLTASQIRRWNERAKNEWRLNGSAERPVKAKILTVADEPQAAAAPFPQIALKVGEWELKLVLNHVGTTAQ